MEAVNVTIGPLVFDHADYDSESDVLYLHVGAPQDAEGEETPEGQSCASRWAPSASSASPSSTPAGCSTATDT